MRLCESCGGVLWGHREGVKGRRFGHEIDFGGRVDKLERIFYMHHSGGIYSHPETQELEPTVAIFSNYFIFGFYRVQGTYVFAISMEA